MRIPEIFVPEKSLEKKVGELAKKKRNSKGRGSYDPTFEEINDRVTPIFEIWSKTIYGKHSQYNTINLKRLPEPYNGWIDFGSKNYDSEGFYC
ncbi:hypothetical protein FJZ53_07065, partial [Candidatus Woesearchaeota archaeon]|nr:hypothetical protein [Candidatus Woesearchaeota archaeon]